MDSMEMYRNNVRVIFDKIATRRGPIPNVPEVIMFLKTHGKLSDETAFRISEQCNTSSGEKGKLKVFIVSLYRINSLSFFLYVLDLINLSDLADEIIRPVSVHRPVHRVDLKYSKHLQEFFYSLKIRVDESSLADRESFLEEERNRLLKASVLLLGSGLSNMRNKKYRNKCAHELAVVTWLQIQHCRRNTETIRNLLCKMVEHWPPDVDKTFCEIIFNSKLGIAYILDGDIERASEHYRIARHLSTAYHDPLTKFIVSHDRRYTNQRFYERTRSKASLQSTLLEAEIGLCFLESDNNGCENFSRLAKRMFYLYIAMARLKVHTDLRVDEAHDDDNRVTSNDENVARNVLNSFESLLDSNQALDPRRSMFYFVCRARLFQLRGQMGLAEQLLSLALDQSECGSHDDRERENMRRFMLILRNRRETSV